MRRALAEDFGVTARWVEIESCDTAENAAHVAALLKREGVTRIALVTHVWHLPRARHLFERQGMTVVAAPTGFITVGSAGGVLDAIGNWLPSAKALRRSYWAAHEWLGLWASIMRTSVDRHWSPSSRQTT